MQTIYGPKSDVSLGSCLTKVHTNDTDCFYDECCLVYSQVDFSYCKRFCDPKHVTFCSIRSHFFLENTVCFFFRLLTILSNTPISLVRPIVTPHYHTSIVFCPIQLYTDYAQVHWSLHWSITCIHYQVWAWFENAYYLSVSENYGRGVHRILAFIYVKINRDVPTCTQMRLCVQFDATNIVFSNSKAFLSGHSKVDKKRS